ncbi:3-isopropylmalate dehydratase small subunit [Enterovirga sp.]|jgi:3-isopropylmalate/(R)-2-methylmalate dehydratase small subunit|uniref:3-isopropylmalate dehydratase small subunit n=1 Tax=Enterovirga sp. TaxID=2026350 RepID=UPI00263736E0|nr:3-isopropylmalate dehydratase small subunit [Enterovirga sp.]MDB5590328.1 leuD [Enterovirga sp.]
MTPFQRCEGVVVPLDRLNVDTDQIIPARFLTSISRSGFGPNLFYGWRYLPAGPGGAAPVPNPDFELNEERFAGAPILLTRRNFGCGSSREHAVWALQQQGFRVVIAPTFGDIFYQNSLKNGFLPVVLPEEAVDELFQAARKANALQLVVDLETQTVSAPSAGLRYSFEIDGFSRDCLLRGLDDVALTLTEADAIRAFETRHLAAYPWLARDLNATT